MSYSPDEHIEDCERALARAHLVKKHYPRAHLDAVLGKQEWCDETALPHATGFSIEIVDKGGGQGALEQILRAVRPVPRDRRRRSESARVRSHMEHAVQPLPHGAVEDATRSLRGDPVAAQEGGMTRRTGSDGATFQTKS